MAKKLKKFFLSQMAENIVRAEEAKERVRKAAVSTREEVFELLETDRRGLNAKEAAVRSEKYGANVLPAGKKGMPRIAAAFANPFTAILLILAVVSLLTDAVFASAGEKNYMTVIVIAVMILVSGGLRFVQELRSGRAAERLSAMIESNASVLRGGEECEIPVSELTVGDVVRLSAGDMVPADLRLIEAKDLFLSQSALTGESAPVEKSPDAAAGAGDLASCACLAFLGTNVVSGGGIGIVAAVGADTLLGQTAKTLTGKPIKTAFEKGVDSISRILLRFMFFMAPLVFVINGLSKGDWLDAALFSVSVAVGLTPEMLPMIVTACMAKGAVSLSKKKVVVKNLNAIQNLGAMDILCTDKTGTLTQDKVVLELHLNVAGEEDARVLRHAFLNSFYQTGLKNLMDVAVIERTNELCETGEIGKDVLSKYKKTDEIPFDFERRRMSVVVQDGEGKRQLITKGAVEEMLAVSSFAELNGELLPLTDELRKKVERRAEELNEQGMRVLAVAQKNDPPINLTAADECGMVLIGYLAFLDPPKSTTAAAIARLREAGISVKILTGDNEKVTACICRKVGLEKGRTLLGSDLDGMNDEELADAALHAQVFAKLSPAQKDRVVRALREKGHTVGFMGDGINDAPALRAADVGISVDTAADIAKESAGVILLEKDLTVVADGVIEGRKTYANMMKYIKITASSNFGNMFSVLAASAFLPFLPMRSLQLVLLNFVYDVSCTAMPWDNVDDESLARPAVWDARSVTGFMVRFGPVSSIFDIITYAVLFFAVCPAVCGAPYAALDAAGKLQFISLFQTGWFVESMVTQSLVIHMLRTSKTPFVQSRASLPVLLLTLCGIGLLIAVPYTALGRTIGLSELPAAYFGFLAAAAAAYMLFVTAVKKAYLRKRRTLI